MRYKLSEFYTKSNLLSFVRVLLAIPTYLLFQNYHSDENIRFYLVGIYLFAFITDIFDGYLARKFNEITELGKVIDPLADKVMVIIIVVMLFSKGIITDFYFYVIILRDAIIFFGGILVTKRIGKVLPSNLLGKLTVLSIGLYLIFATLNLDIFSSIESFFYNASLILSFTSVAGYGIRGYEAIKWSNKDETL